MTEAIRTDSFFPHPPEKVWRALTDPQLLAAWLMPNDFEPRVGHRFTFRTDPVPAHGFDEDDPGQQATMRILGGGWFGHLARRLGQTLDRQP